MAAQRGCKKMIEALELHHAPIHITGSRSAPVEAEC